MRKLMLLLLAIVTMASCSQEEKVNVRWATFNMRYDNQGDAPNHWGPVRNVWLNTSRK